jgi:hypothetical protein
MKRITKHQKLNLYRNNSYRQKELGRGKAAFREDEAIL